MRDNGYHVMVSGKDDLTKETGCGVNGTYRSEQLGFSDQARCKGKWDVDHSYPTPSDPYGEYLSTLDLWAYYKDCMQKGACCNPNSYNKHECPIPANFTFDEYEDNWNNNRTISLLERRPENTPWFLQINYPGPHPPFAILESMNKSVKTREYPYPFNCSFPKEDMEIVRRDYVAEIENIDNLFKDILDYLQNSSPDDYENTIICIR